MTGEDLRTQLSPEHPPALWVVGDVMLDRYLAGRVDCISPEAPVAVLRLSTTWDRMGGAANVAHNVTTLGGVVALAGVVGNDEAGHRLRQLAQEAGIFGVVLQQQPGHGTTVKTRAVSGAHQLLRIDSEERTGLSSTEMAALVDGLVAAVPTPDAILVSDYDKGVVSPELIAALSLKARGAPLFVDPKGRDYLKYRGVALLTPNEREISLASGIEVKDDASLLQAVAALRQLGVSSDVVVTRGARGMTLVAADGTALHSGARARRTFDVTGAGDTAIAALALARACSLDWRSSLTVANVAAGIAVGKVGTAPVYRSELLSALASHQFGLKVLDRRALAELRATTAILGQRLVFTNGCFDLLHVGHLGLLQSARALGDLLVVAVNSDASVRRLKGAARPIVGEADRAALLAGLESVDFVTIFDEDTPLEAILACRPDVLVKGGDYLPAEIVGAREVEGWGGRVATVPIAEGQSTTRLIERVGAATARE